MSIATLLNKSTAVFGQSIHGSSIVCQVGTPRNTMYALERPANSMMTAVSRIQTPSCPFEIGNDDQPKSGDPPPPPDGGTGGGGTGDLSCVSTGIFNVWP